MNKKIKSASTGGIFFLAANALLAASGCSPQLKDCPAEFANAPAPLQKYGVITEVQEIEKGQFKVISEVPSKCSGVILTHMDGSSEIIPQQKAELIARYADPGGIGLDLGTVLASGLFGYMLGRTPFISSHIYANEGIYRQTLARKDVITEKTGRTDQPNISFDASLPSGRQSSGRYGGRQSYGTAGAKRGGFFSNFFGRFSS
ncbi:MAG: hypothetical protein L7F77_05545 [Candidatus Magnetominusculus sp. LBB02]|nr:hypothetical protein [Candidatus Magnetominusculus sp. LBB02]